MENHIIQNPPNYSDVLRALLTSDPAHADTFNPLFERLINNDAYLKAFIEGMLAPSNGHKHSGVDGDGAKIPFEHIDVPTELGGLVTDQDMENHINERNPHGTRASDVNAASASDLDEHQKEYMPHDAEVSYICSNIDSNGVYKTVTYTRTDKTTYMISTLSNSDAAGNYQTCKWQFYDEMGTTVTETKVWTLTYDDKNNVISAE